MSTWKEKASPFIAGCFVTAGILASQGAIGTSGIDPEAERIVRMTAQETTRAVLASIEAEEEKQLESLPDPLDCNSFSWMESCEEINRQAKKNPTAPIRVKSKEGIEFNFPPGTSTAMMRHLLDGTEESTRAFIEELDQKMKHHTEASSRYNRLLWARGGFESMETSADIALQNQSKARDSIDTEKVAISVFYDTECSACKTTLSNLKLLKEKYPELQITAFQVNQNPDGPKEVKDLYNLPAREVSISELNKLRDAGFRGTPTIWFDNRPEKKRLARLGPVSLTVIENELERISLYESGGQ